jgi:DNA-binding transcriptional regulator of glucitol operon
VTTEVAVVILIVVAWGLQIWMSNQQMRRFNSRSHELRRTGDLMAVGLSGNTYRRKVYTILVTTYDGRVTAAEELAGSTVFANTRPLPAVIGFDVFDIGEGEPPEGVSAKTWASLEHAAGFIEKKLQQPPSSHDTDSGGGSGGEMA